MTDGSDARIAPARPRLGASVAALHHLLLVAADVDEDEVATLVGSLVVGADWRATPTPSLPGVLDLLAAERLGPAIAGTTPSGHDGATPARATLTGPWRVDLRTRHALGLPSWVVAAYVLDVDAERSAPPPPHPGGYGRLLDAFPGGHPVGLEREALDALLACARRLAGALRTTTGVLIECDPASAVDLTLYSPTWLSPAALHAALAPALPDLEVLPGIDAEQAARLDGYGALWHAVDGAAGGGWAAGTPGVTGYAGSEHDPHHTGAEHDPHDPETVLVEVEAAEVLPPALAATPWTAGGVITYRLRWLGGPADREPGSRLARRRRDDVVAAIERAAGALHAAVGGEIVDEDGLVVDAEQLTT